MRNYKQITANTYDSIAREYVERDLADTADEKFVVRQTIDYFISKLNPDSQVLDVGFGGGRDSRYLKKAGIQVISIDNAPAMINLAKKMDPSGDYRLMDFEDLSLPAKFDAIWANASLHHVPKANLPKVLSRLHDLLKPGGFIQVIIKEGEGEGIRSNHKFGRQIERYFAFYSPDEIRQVFEQAGFKNIDISSQLNREWLYIHANK